MAAELQVCLVHHWFDCPPDGRVQGATAPVAFPDSNCVASQEPDPVERVFRELRRTVEDRLHPNL